MDLFLEEVGTLPFATTRHLVTVPVPVPTLVILTDHQVGTAVEAPSPGHFWQALFGLLPVSYTHLTLPTNREV